MKHCSKILAIGLISLTSAILLAQRSFAQSGPSGVPDASSNTPSTSGAPGTPGTTTEGKVDKIMDVVDTIMKPMGPGGTVAIRRGRVTILTPDGGGLDCSKGVCVAGAGAGGLGIGGAYNPLQIAGAACAVMFLPEGPFGALVMVVSGLVAIVSAALGAYRTALSTIVIGCGSWILGPVVNLFFPAFAC